MNKGIKGRTNSWGKRELLVPFDIVYLGGSYLWCGPWPSNIRIAQELIGNAHFQLQARPTAESEAMGLEPTNLYFNRPSGWFNKHLSFRPSSVVEPD